MIVIVEVILIIIFIVICYHNNYCFYSFSITGTVMTLDTHGIMRALMCSAGWQWTPVLDLNKAKKTPDHRLWPVTVKGNRLSHVLLNGESRPATYPQPVTTMKVFHLSIPEVREGKDSKAQNERVQLLLWESTMTAHLESVKALETTTGVLPEGMTSQDLQNKLDYQSGESDKATLSLFQIACQQQRNEQAMGHAFRLRTDPGLQSAMQIADHFGRTNIAAAINGILTAKQEMAQEAAWQEQQQQQQQQGNGDSQYDSQEDQENTQPIEVYSNSSSISRRANQNREEEDDFESDTFQADSAPVRKPQPVNPFATKGSPLKRKSVIESMRDLKGSPSPKKATLSVS